MDRILVSLSLTQVMALLCTATCISMPITMTVTIIESIKVSFSIQTNNDNIYAFVNMNTERAGNEVIYLYKFPPV